ncbi:MAG: hypothetical protein AAFV96_06950, partial [Pseudomonadota bacterium]
MTDPRSSDSGPADARADSGAAVDAEAAGSAAETPKPAADDVEDAEIVEEIAPVAEDAEEAEPEAAALEEDTAGQDDAGESGMSPPDAARVLPAALATAPLVDDGRVPDPSDTAEVDLAEEDDYHDEDHEAVPRSLASRVLTWLLILVAGGAATLWAAP